MALLVLGVPNQVEQGGTEDRGIKQVAVARWGRGEGGSGNGLIKKPDPRGKATGGGKKTLSKGGGRRGRPCNLS